MATYTFDQLNGQLLTSVAAQLDQVPAATKATYNIIEVENLGISVARAWIWRLASGAVTVPHYINDLRPNANPQDSHGSRDAVSLARGMYLAPGQKVNIAAYPRLIKASGELWGMTGFATFGLVSTTEVTSTAEIAFAGTKTYAATTATDSTAAFTASANQNDLVGRRVEVPTRNVYMICTANTATVITGSGGWIDMNTGLVGVTPTAGDACNILASLRDNRSTGNQNLTTIAANLYVGHRLIQDTLVGTWAPTKYGTIVGNSAGVVTYGSTFQIASGGWTGGTPTATNPWAIESLVRVHADWVEES